MTIIIRSDTFAGVLKHRMLSDRYEGFIELPEAILYDLCLYVEEIAVSYFPEKKKFEELEKKNHELDAKVKAKERELTMAQTTVSSINDILGKIKVATENNIDILKEVTTPEKPKNIHVG